MVNIFFEVLVEYCCVVGLFGMFMVWGLFEDVGFFVCYVDMCEVL